MNKPVLVVMAAGMGSRYGGMKQIDPVGPNGQVIVDYSLYDARRRAVSSPGAPATPFWRQRTSSTARLRSSMPMIITARRPSG